MGRCGAAGPERPPAGSAASAQASGNGRCMLVTQRAHFSREGGGSALQADTSSMAEIWIQSLSKSLSLCR